MERLVEFIERAMVKRRPGLVDRASLALVGSLRPGVLETRETFRRHFVEAPRIAVAAASDTDPDLFRRWGWGDAWMKYDLSMAFGRLGFVVTDLLPDVVIHLFGRPMPLPKDSIRVLWVHSHPEDVNRDLLTGYDAIFCLSQKLAERIRGWGFTCRVLWPATTFTPTEAPLRHEVVFVGNARANGRRPVVDLLSEPAFRFEVWGRGYHNLPKNVLKGEHYDYRLLPSLYAASAITLNDHAPTMAAESFVTPRVFDVLASGGFCISDANSGLTEIFGDTVPQYRSPGELSELIHHYLTHPGEREKLRGRGQHIALSHSYEARAHQLVEGLTLPLAPRSPQSLTVG